MLVPHRQRLPSSARLACSASGIRILLEQRHRRHHEARRAEAAHQAVVIAERLLNGMERVAREPARRPSGCSCPALRSPASSTSNRCGRARTLRRWGFDDDRAGAARAAIADALRPGDLEPRAHRVKQRDARFDLQLQPPAVDRQRDRHLARTDRRRALRFGVCHPGNDRGGNRPDPDGLEEVATRDVLVVFLVVHRGRIRLFGPGCPG